MKQIDIGTAKLQVQDEGQGPPVVLVHGFPLDHSMWQAQVEALREQYRVIVPDLRGFGGSDVTEGTVTMEQLADDLHALLGALEISEPIRLCGLSMGGYVAFRFWRSYAAQVAALILCDTKSAPDTDEAAVTRRKTADKVMRDGPDPLVRAMFPKLIAESTEQRSPGVVESLRTVMMNTDRRAISAALLGMAVRPDSTPLLESITVPTLVVVGEHDAISPVVEMEQIAQGIKNARFEVIEGSGHMAAMEAPEEFNRVLLEFLGGI